MGAQISFHKFLITGGNSSINFSLTTTNEKNCSWVFNLYDGSDLSLPLMKLVLGDESNKKINIYYMNKRNNQIESKIQLCDFSIPLLLTEYQLNICSSQLSLQMVNSSDPILKKLIENGPSFIFKYESNIILNKIIAIDAIGSNAKGILYIEKLSNKSN
jgi:hypothetical protein